jgi:3-methylcrotonyl-CoA carboxylase beta subunit
LRRTIKLLKAMPLKSSTDPASSDFAHNAEAMRALVAELREKLDQVAGGGGEASRVRHTTRGKMLADIGARMRGGRQ